MLEKKDILKSITKNYYDKEITDKESAKNFIN